LRVQPIERGLNQKSHHARARKSSRLRPTSWSGAADGCRSSSPGARRRGPVCSPETATRGAETPQFRTGEIGDEAGVWPGIEGRGAVPLEFILPEPDLASFISPSPLIGARPRVPARRTLGQMQLAGFAALYRREAYWSVSCTTPPSTLMSPPRVPMPSVMNSGCSFRALLQLRHERVQRQADLFHVPIGPRGLRSAEFLRLRQQPLLDV